MDKDLIKAAMDRNGIVIDIDALAKELSFVRDMSDLEVLTAFCVYKTGSYEGASKLLLHSVGDITNIARNQYVCKIIQHLIRNDIKTLGVKKAYDALISIVEDSGESATARNKAADTILKWSGEIGGTPEIESQRQLEGMSVEQLEDIVQQIESKRAEKAKAVE